MSWFKYRIWEGWKYKLSDNCNLHNRALDAVYIDVKHVVVCGEQKKNEVLEHQLVSIDARRCNYVLHITVYSWAPLALGYEKRINIAS